MRKSLITRISKIPVTGGLLILLLASVWNDLFGQPGQIDIDRVTQMPDLPSPYLMRDWKAVAKKYDALIYSPAATGQYLPLIGLGTSGVNYPSIQPILLDTYVGTVVSGQAEAINVLPSLVGASLVGIDKRSQNGINWVIKARDFFNKANGQNVYLNGYSTTSGNDWWYDLMPNVYFYQLYTLYPDQPDFETQFTTLADRWLEAVHAMGGSNVPWTIPEMNYRAFHLNTMLPNNTGVKEPESAGTIAWLLYHAYLQTDNKKYLDGAQLAMEFLSGLSSNPSYELQLAYGTFIAAKMNAELGAAYDVDKMLNWVFDRGSLRGWGTIVGKWDNTDVAGLIGEANDAGDDYAFVMNGYQHVAALLPLVKYDKRYARAIGKWVLNLANASRLFYAPFRPPSSQDDYAWSAVHDPDGVIAYEALKETVNGKKLYATGDAKKGGWAQTNLSLYSSSSVGYLGSVLTPTNVEGILLMDVNKTDFFGANKFPSYLVYNPHAEPVSFVIDPGDQQYDIYDAISEIIINVSGNTTITVPANQAMLLVYLPHDVNTVSRNGRLYAGNDVVDYHFGYDFHAGLRIKSLGTITDAVETGEQVQVYSAIENAGGSVNYKWFVNDVLTASSDDNDNFIWTAASVEGEYKIVLQITSGEMSVKDSITVNVRNTVVSVEEEAMASTIQIYPVPSKGRLYISGVHQPIKSITLYDVTGRKIDITYSTSSENQIVELDMTLAKAGMGFIKIATEENFIFKKIMIGIP